MARVLLFVCVVGFLLCCAYGRPISTLTAVSVHLPPGVSRATSGRDRGLLTFEWDGNPEAEWGPTELARAYYNETVDTTGWGVLAVYTNPNTTLDDETKAFAAGQAEGNLTSLRIWQSAVNNGLPGAESTINAATKQYLATHYTWMQQMQENAETLPVGSLERAYWHQTKLVRQQLEGVYAGYKLGAAAGQDTLTDFEIQLLTTGSTIQQVNGLLGMEDLNDKSKWDKHRRMETFLNTSNKCSALLKLAPGNQDFFMAQITWSEFTTMLRTYKLYDFPFTLDGISGQVPGQRVAFSSYPGSIFSGDDFYLTSAGLVVQETTIGNSNPELWTLWLTPMSVFESYRNIIANKLSNNAEIWGDIFGWHNSGTYNNQFMVFDYKLFKPGQPLQPGTFYVMEQIPGHVRNDDQTALLQQQGYYASYNMAFYPDIAELSGQNQLEQEFGSWFSYSNTARAEVFRRNQANVSTIDDMQKIMRYNNFKVDPLSTQLNTCAYIGWTNCTPPYTAENTISARCDLNDPTGVYSLSNFGLRNHGGIDAKITSFSTYNNFTLPARVISGPTNDQQPTFVFSQSPYSNLTRLGLPDAWNFPWLWTTWN